MAICNSTQIIAPTECIGDSLVKINNNFSNLDSNICSLHSNLYSLVPVFSNLRISLDPSAPIVTSDIINAPNIYIHPYEGNAVSLFNTTTNTWDIKLIPQVLPFSLIGLFANSNYDIFLYHDGTSFQIEFVLWPNSTRGNSTGSPKTLLNGIYVKTGSSNKRYIGCLRTTLPGCTEISFGRKWVLGGSHPKFFLWNAQNRVPAAFSIFDGANWNVTGPGNGRASFNGPLSNFGYRSEANPGAGNRVSFITGEVMTVEMHQDHWSSGTWAYLTHVLDLDQYDSPYVIDVHEQGQFVSETQGQITHHSNFTVSAGYHFVQELAMSYGGGTYWVFELHTPSGGNSTYPGGRHSYGATGRISSY